MNPSECNHAASQNRPNGTILGLRNAIDIGRLDTESKPVVELMNWLYEYIVKPNTDLGRIGAVCPFVQPALDANRLWIAVVEREIREDLELLDIMGSYLRTYHSFKSYVGPESGLTTLMIAFPGLQSDACPAMIDRVHYAMKPSVVDMGLMLGEFYPGNTSPGIRNPKFHPLRSPVPLFVIRQMVPGDLIFLNDPTAPPHRRIQFLHAYLKCMEQQKSIERLEEIRCVLTALEGTHCTPLNDAHAIHAGVPELDGRGIKRPSVAERATNAKTITNLTGSVGGC